MEKYLAWILTLCLLTATVDLVVAAPKIDPIKFTLSTTARYLQLNEEFEITIQAEYQNIIPNTAFVLKDANSFRLKLTLPEGFIKTGGDYYDYVGTELTRSNPKVSFKLKGKFTSENSNATFELLRSHRNADNQSTFVAVGKLMFNLEKHESRVESGSQARIAAGTAGFVPYMTIAQLRSGFADTAKVVQVDYNDRAYTYRYDATSTAADDSVKIIVSGSRRYLLNSDVVTPRMYGAKGDGTTNDREALAFMFSKEYLKAGGTVVIDTDYNLNGGTLEIPKEVSVEFKNGSFKNGKVRLSSLDFSSTDKISFDVLKWDRSYGTLDVEIKDPVTLQANGATNFVLRIKGRLSSKITVNPIEFSTGVSFTDCYLDFTGSADFRINNTTRDSRFIFENCTVTRTTANTGEIAFGAYTGFIASQPLLIMNGSRFTNIAINSGDCLVRATNCTFKAGDNNNGNHELLHVASQISSDLSHVISGCVFDGQFRETDLLDTYSSTNVLVENCRFINKADVGGYPVITVKSHTGNMNPLDYETAGNRDGLIFRNNFFENCAGVIFSVFTTNRDLVAIPDDARKSAVTISGNFVKIDEEVIKFVELYNAQDVRVSDNIIKSYSATSVNLVALRSLATLTLKVRNLIVTGNQLTCLPSLEATIPNSSLVLGAAFADLDKCIISNNMVSKGYAFNFTFGTCDNVLISNNIIGTGSVFQPFGGGGAYTNVKFYAVNNIAGGRVANVGTTGERPVVNNTGDTRFNISTGTPEWYNGTTWVTYTTSLSGSKTFDPPSIAAGATVSTTITVTGAALGQISRSSFSVDLTDQVSISSRVSSANTATVVFHNVGSGAIDLASGTITVKVE